MLTAQDTTRYFFNPEIDYGSAGIANPFTIVLQNGTEMLAYHENSSLKTFPYRFSADLLFREMTNPVKTVRDYGFGNMINDEFFPFDPGSSNGSIVPNVMLHFIGGGFTYAWTAEYYRYHGFKHPRAMAAATVYLKNLVNEMSEMPPYEVTRVDAISDLFFWDALAIVVFDRPGVKRFFSETIGLYNWGTMPVLTPDGRLRNTNAYYAFRPVRTGWNINPVVVSGLGFLAGVSINGKNGIAFSATAGVLSHSVKPGSEFSNEAPELIVKPAAGFFLDRNNSVLWNVIVKFGEGGNIRSNLYPGLGKGVFRNVGVYAEAGNSMHAGIVWRIPGAGLGF